MKRWFKKLLPKGRAPRTVLAGLYRGLRLELDLQSELLIYLGCYEAEIAGAIRRLAVSCRSGLDLGAGGGELTLWLLRQPGMARVVAVEPLDREQQRLERTLLLNGAAGDRRLVRHPGFAGPGPAPLYRSISDLLTDAPGPILIKIDIDGPEAEVLADASPILHAEDCRLVIETHSPRAEEGCIRILDAARYQHRIIQPAWWRKLLPEQRPLPHNRWLIGWRSSAVTML